MTDWHIGGFCPHCGSPYGLKAMPTLLGQATVICASCKRVDLAASWNRQVQR